jgi:hypothetical protein
MEPWTVGFKGAFLIITNLSPLLNTHVNDRMVPGADRGRCDSPRRKRQDCYEPRVKKRAPEQYKLVREPVQVPFVSEAGLHELPLREPLTGNPTKPRRRKN